MILFEKLLVKNLEFLSIKQNVMLYTSKQFDEAEFKITKLIRKNKIVDFAVVSPDSDFIILMLILLLQKKEEK